MKKYDNFIYRFNSVFINNSGVAIFKTETILFRFRIGRESDRTIRLHLMKEKIVLECAV